MKPKKLFLLILLPLGLLLCIALLFNTVRHKVTDLLRDRGNANKKKLSEVDELNHAADLYNNGQIDEAQRALLSFTKAHKNYYLAWTILGHTYLDQAKLEEASQAYNMGIKANKNAFEPHNGLGMLYESKEEYDKAKREFEIADSIKPNESTVIANIASLYEDLGDLKNAIKYGIRSVQLDSANADIVANLALYFHEDNQFAERNKMFGKSVQLGYKNLPELRTLLFPDDSAEGFLQICGTVTHGNTDKEIEEVKIEVLNEDSLVIKELYTDEKGKYNFSLALNDPAYYLVKISYPKYITKLYAISTRNIPLQQQKTKFSLIEADLGLSEIIEGVDYSVLEKPLNRYYYNSDKNNFEYDKPLLDASLKKLKALKEQEEKMKK